MKIHFSFILLLLAGIISAQQALNIIPIPVSSSVGTGLMSINNMTSISGDQKADAAIKELKTYLSNHYNIQLKPNKGQKTNHLIFKKLSSPDKTLGNEGYRISVQQSQATIEANEAAGFFYAVATLEQMVEKKGSKITIPVSKIEDYPRFGWRGLMLDVSRHFFTVGEVKKFIDQMAEYKFNVFHWHLTDDEGWRIEIKSLPKLTEVGAWRVERFGSFGDGRPYPTEGEKATIGGYYTQEQIKEVVAYAAAKHITIVPEIDIPGHSMSALAAYPELSVGRTPKFVNPGSKFSEWYGNGTFKMLIENTLNPADEKVYEFVDKVFTEVAALFPGSYIHMGGDECYKGYWEASDEVKAFMNKNDLKDSHELQSYFVKRVEKIISSKGKKLIGWDEILEGGLADGAAVMSWRGMKGGIEAAKMGHKVVMSPTTFAYLDYTQGDRSVETNIYADLSLQKSYEFEPLPEGVDPAMVLGGQGNVWTEAIPTLDYAMYMTYPRALAIAESVWSLRSKKSWTSFVGRVEQHFSRFDHTKTTISKAVLDPIITVKKTDKGPEISLSKGINGGEIRYSIDNTYPLNNAKVYTSPILLPTGKMILRTQTFRDGMPIGRMLQLSREEIEKRAK
jgi:hexosaminidase